VILVFDIGNSRIKWKLTSLHCVEIAAGVFDPKLGVDDFIRDVSLYSVERIWIAEVGDVLQQYGLLDKLKQVWPSAKVTEVFSQRECLGVINSYDEPWRLGVDRWLAVIEAWHCSDGAPVAVFDLGTAAKLDVVVNGEHQGGYIVPGLNMMRDTLQSNTRKVCFASY
jgi:type III pantothenate kinase